MIHFKRALILLFFTLQHFTVSADCQKCDNPPKIFCQSLVYISLDQNGEALLREDMLLEYGTHDDCTPIQNLKYRIMVPSTHKDKPPSDAMSAWPLDCSYLGYNTADIWVGDDMDNWSKCIVSIIVEDKLDPLIVCPDDITISCDMDHHELSVTGELEVNYVCAIDVKIGYEDEVLSETCATKVIKREWKYYDKSGDMIIACKQIITKGQASVESNIIWPEDIGLYDCDLKPDDVDPITISGEPQFLISSCGDVHVLYNDEVFKTCDEQYTIHRTWDVLDWCNAMVFTHVQEIVLTCSRPPVAYCMAPLIASVTKDGVLVYAVDFDAGSYDLCDLDISITVSINGSPFDDKFYFDCTDLGTYDVVLKVENEAGEVDYCKTQLTIVDDLKICDRTQRLTSSTESMANRQAKFSKVYNDVNSSSFSSVYPNPTSGLLHIELGVVVDFGHVNIYNTYGALLKTIGDLKTNDKLFIDTQILGVAGNMLFVEIFDGNISTVEKVILIK